MGGKPDCNVCYFSVVWYDEEAWEDIPGQPRGKKELREGFHSTPDGMTVYCKLNKKFFKPSHVCKAWRDIKEKRR